MGGHWTHGNSGGGAQTPPVSPQTPGIGHNGGPPLEELPEITVNEPSSRANLIKQVKQIARWLALAARTIGRFDPRVRAVIAVIEATGWLRARSPQIESYSDPPKSLEELQRAFDHPKPGYHIHHIVEQTSAMQDGYPPARIHGRENLVRIPEYKHHEITRAYSLRNGSLGNKSLRDHLREKPWQERYDVSLEKLRRHGVLK